MGRSGEYEPDPPAAAAHRRGRGQYDKGRYERAIESLTEAIGLDPGYERAFELRSRAFERLGDEGRAWADLQEGAWLRHRRVCRRDRVRPGERRTTPPPYRDVRRAVPELADLAATAVRLHPRHGDEPAVTASKLGGTFLWPAAEPWPACAEHGIPLVGVLQLRADDVPELGFPPEADLFQLLWCPRDHLHAPDDLRAKPAAFWRRRAAVAEPRPDNPTAAAGRNPYVPLPCLLMPERVVEYPGSEDLPEGLRKRLREVLAPEEVGTRYGFELSVADGTKVGGHVGWIQSGGGVVCRCGRPMEHLLTVASREWHAGNFGRWCPVEDRHLERPRPRTMQQVGAREAASGAPGLRLGGLGKTYLFLCRRCADWPLRAVCQCS